MDELNQQQNIEQKNTGIPGLLVDGVFWHWQKEISIKSIENRRAQLRAEKITRILAILFSIGLTAVAAVGLFYSYTESLKLTTEVFLSEINWSWVAFWTATLSWQFVFFLVLKNKLTVHRFPKSKIKPEFSTIPSLAAASKRKDLANILTGEGFSALEQGFELSYKSKHSEVLPIHIFIGSVSTQSIATLFMRLDITFSQLKDALRRRMNTLEGGETVFGLSAENIVARAAENSVEHNIEHISSVELFIESYKADEFLQELFYSIGVTDEQVKGAVSWMRINERLKERYLEFRKAAAFKPTKNMNRAYTAIATPFLDRVSEDLTRAATSGRLPMLIGRKRETDEILRSIEGGRQSIVLTGPAGVGKKSILYGIAEMMAAETVPASLQDKRLLRLDIPVIVSSKGGAGAQERLLYALQEVGGSGNIILVIENIDALIGEGGIDLSSILAGELEKGYTFVLATTTPQGYAKLEKTALGNKLQKITVNEPERAETISILQSKISGIENKNKVIFTYQALESLVDLSDRYLHDSYQPVKAVKISQEVALSEKNKDKEWSHVSKEDIEKIISEKSQVPVTQIGQEEGEQLLHLEERMHQRIIGQEEAVRSVSSALRRARTELRSEDRPIANFLFLGPTGVGKTEMAKTTAEVYFGDEDIMIRFDMSEYQNKESIARLIGGAGEAGLLTDVVRKNPFSLLLLDELEKAHPDILNLFLQVMDDGRLTDGSGRTIDFTNVILIATSNAGTQFIQDSVAQKIPMEQVKTQLMEEELKGVYRPEFLNRFDGVIVFTPLTTEDVIAIAYLMMKTVEARLEAKGIHFKATDEAVHELAQKGYDPKFGARPLRRVIQEGVDNPIAEFLLKGEVIRRDTLVLGAGGNISIEKAEEL